MTTYLRLRGPNTSGMSPKACPVTGWNEPGTPGVGDDWPDDMWIGLRLEDHVVIDCDDESAKDAWLAHIGTADLGHTWVRKTPHGYHLIYNRTEAACMIPSRKLLTVAPKLELKTGYGHQVVFRAPGYFDLHARPPADFNVEWEPAAAKHDHVVDEWSEVPDGIGDNFMISVAGKLREWGADENTIAACLDAINKVTMTIAPMPPKSIARIARQAAKWPAGW